MIKKSFLLFFFFSSFCFSNAQDIAPADLTRLKLYEDTLRSLGDSLIRSEHEIVRQKSCYDFIRTLVRALQVKGSFYYAFDALTRKDSFQIISMVEPEDKSFRIFNWALARNNGTYRYYGAIQMKSSKPLKTQENFFPLFDYSDFVRKDVVTDTVLNDSSWFGAVYFNIISKKAKGKKYYFLFGWDGNNLLSNKKLIDVLYFMKGKPRFGAPLFEIITDTVLKTKKLQTRFLLEYKKDANVSLNYNPDLGKIVFDHLVSEIAAREFKYTYIPDGTYEGFEWKNGKWIYIEKVWTQTQAVPPRPFPKTEDKGIK